MARILVVDDDSTVREVVTSYLRAAHHEVIEASAGGQAIEAMRLTPADLVVLDVMMPGLDGREVCRRLRAVGQVPIIFLSALGAPSDRVMGLELGADDYLTKPFSPRELVLRIETILRRIDPTPRQGTVVDGNLAADLTRHEVTLNGVVLTLTGREFDLLTFFMQNPGMAYSRTELLQQVWGWSFGDESTVTVHVRRLREKVEPNPARPQRIATVWGVGYRWEPHGEVAADDS